MRDFIGQSGALDQAVAAAAVKDFRDDQPQPRMSLAAGIFTQGAACSAVLMAAMSAAANGPGTVGCGSPGASRVKGERTAEGHHARHQNLNCEIPIAGER